MKKLAAVLSVLLIAGCSSMGADYSSSGGVQPSGATGSDIYGGGSYNGLSAPSIDPRTGQLTPYHGG